MKPLKWVAVGLGVLVLAAIIYIVIFPRYLGPTKSGQAVLQSQKTLKACEAYRDNHANPERGKYPATLGDLVKPPFGGSSFLQDGEAGLIDPWGNPYRYAVLTNAKGEQEVYVWSERIVDGKLKLLGAKRRADGTIERFGGEE